MSRMMEGVGFIRSAGRTVYELAHMHIPSIVLAQARTRGTAHTFARADHAGLPTWASCGNSMPVPTNFLWNYRFEPERRNVSVSSANPAFIEKNKAK